MTGAAVAKYEWSLNGTVMATTATYEVPASAKDGDEIKLTVTAEDGQTASDTVYVGGFTILKVEPLAQGNTYKYVKAYFSSALTSLSPSEIEIRGKKDQKLYSIQTAVLASDGMAADLTLYGSSSEDDTSFLRANTAYVMTLTQNGQSTSLEFELPAYATDMVVTSVDIGKNTITTSGSFRTGWQNAYAPGTFNVAGKYTGNLGTLIGRTVNYGYDTDLNLTSFSLDDAEVVYGAMKFVNDDNNLETAYFKDTLTGETYKWNKDTFTASKNATLVYTAHDGKDAGVPDNGTDYQYTKLVLNPDGTVSTANVVDAFAQNLFVTDVEETKVIQDKDNAFDLDGYTIVKDDAYVSPDDLELGDVVFINTEKKFADVYNNEISGELSNVVSGKLDIDETTYNWNGAQYYDDDDEVYKKLSTGDDNEASQAYLNSLDTETDTTIWIARDGKIKYLDGTVVGVKKYTYTTYLVTETAKPYTESLKDKFNVKVFDGTTTSTVTIDLSQLKFYKGVAGSFKATTPLQWQTGGDEGKFTFKGSKDNTKDKTTYDIDNAGNGGDLLAGSLVKFMFDEDNNLVGFSDNEDAADAVIEDITAGSAVTGTSSLNGSEILGQTSSPNLKAASNKFVQNKGDQTKEVYTMGSFTNLWIWNEKEPAHGGTAKDDAFTKVALTDFENEIKTDVAIDRNDNDHALLGISYRVDGTKVTDLVVHILNDKAYKEADNNTINGVLVGITYKNDETDTTQIMSKVTIYGTDGVKTTYTVNKDAVGPIAAVAKTAAGAYVTLTQNKATEEITAVALTDRTWDQDSANKNKDDQLIATHDTANFHNDKLILATIVNGKNIELTTTSDGVIMKRYQKEGSWKYEVVDYTDVNVHDGAVNVWYNTTRVSEDKTKVQSDMIVVELLAKAETPVASGVTVTQDAAAGTITANKKISTNFATLTATLTSGKEIESAQWYVNGAAVDTATTIKATPTKLDNPVAGDKVYVKLTDADGKNYVSDTYELETPTFTAFALAAAMGNNNAVTSKTETAASMITGLDQFGAAIAIPATSAVTTATAMVPGVQDTSGAGTAKIAFKTTGEITITAALTGTTDISVDDTFTYALATGQTLTATVTTASTEGTAGDSSTAKFKLSLV